MRGMGPSENERTKMTNAAAETRQPYYADAEFSVYDGMLQKPSAVATGLTFIDAYRLALSLDRGEVVDGATGEVLWESDQPAAFPTMPGLLAFLRRELPTDSNILAVIDADHATATVWNETFDWAFGEYRDLAASVRKAGTEDAPRDGEGDLPLTSYFDNVGDTIDERGIRVSQVPDYVNQAEEEWYTALDAAEESRRVARRSAIGIETDAEGKVLRWPSSFSREQAQRVIDGIRDARDGKATETVRLALLILDGRDEV